MKTVLVALKSHDKSIEYSIDIESSNFESSVIDADGSRSIVQTGSIGSSDAERQDLALRMYHILLAALRAPRHEGG